jgi:hypothetical protein
MRGTWRGQGKIVSTSQNAYAQPVRGFIHFGGELSPPPWSRSELQVPAAKADISGFPAT